MLLFLTLSEKMSEINLKKSLKIFKLYPEAIMSRKFVKQPCKWLEEYRGKGFNGPMPSLPQLFKLNVERYPDNECWECFVPEHICLTYSQAYKHICNVASTLVSLGVKKGDCVGLTGKNSPEWATAYLAIQSMGAVVAPIDYSLSDEEIEHFMDFVNVKGVFVDGERFDRIGKDNKYGFKFSLSKENEDVIDKYIFNLEKKNNTFILPEYEDMAAYLFTSGTTGTPKAVMLTHGNFVSDAFSAQYLMSTFSDDIYYAILPVHHAYTMLAVFIEAFSVGAKVIFGKRLSVSQILKEMKLGKVNMLLAVPMVYNKFMAGVLDGLKKKGKLVYVLGLWAMHISGTIKKITGINVGKLAFKSILEQLSMENIRICIAGGGPLPPSTFKHFNALGIDFVQGYGLTETSPILTLNPLEDYEEKSIGKLLHQVEMKFINKDEDGNGEICVKGPMVMKGYYNNPEATSEIIDQDGFLHTGDVGYMDKKGFVYLTGRAKNIIVTEGGKNVFPEEIEDHFQLYDDIEQICVVGYMIDAVKKSEGIAAFIYPSTACQRKITDKDEMKAHMEEIIEKVNKELLPYKRIRKIFIVDQPMEQTSTKKIKRNIVKKQYAELLK